MIDDTDDDGDDDDSDNDDTDDDEYVPLHINVWLKTRTYYFCSRGIRVLIVLVLRSSSLLSCKSTL